MHHKISHVIALCEEQTKFKLSFTEKLPLYPSSFILFLFCIFKFAQFPDLTKSELVFHNIAHAFMVHIRSCMEKCSMNILQNISIRIPQKKENINMSVVNEQTFHYLGELSL